MARTTTRIDATLDVENTLWAAGHRTLAGMDEVGRGAWAGPVTVGVAVARPDCGPPPEGLRDSKLMTARARTAMVSLLHAWLLGAGIGSASPAEIDTHGISLALRLAARRALDGLRGPVDLLLLDGNVNFVPGPTPGYTPRRDRPLPPVQTEIRGDTRCALIAAASVLAKVHRDELMATAAQTHPAYGWESNSGYGGASVHQQAVAHHGLTDWHRRSWAVPAGARVPTAEPGRNPSKPDHPHAHRSR